MSTVVTHTQAATLVSVALTNAPTLQPLIAGRVTSAHPDAGAVEPTYPLIVTTYRTGAPRYHGRMTEIIFQVWAYSRISQGEAGEVYDVACAVLQAERLTSTAFSTVIVCQATSGPIEVYDEPTRTWATYGNWMARAIG